VDSVSVTRELKKYREISKTIFHKIKKGEEEIISDGFFFSTE